VEVINRRDSCCQGRIIRYEMVVLRDSTVVDTFKFPNVAASYMWSPVDRQGRQLTGTHSSIISMLLHAIIQEHAF
jgi:hypothetical protein